MQKPMSFPPLAEEPESLAGGGFHAVVIAADDTATPPGRLDPLWAPVPRHAVIVVLVPEPDRRTVGRDRSCFNGDRWREEEQGAMAGQASRRASELAGWRPFSFARLPACSPARLPGRSPALHAGHRDQSRSPLRQTRRIYRAGACRSQRPPRLIRILRTRRMASADPPSGSKSRSARRREDPTSM